MIYSSIHFIIRMVYLRPMESYLFLLLELNGELTEAGTNPDRKTSQTIAFLFSVEGKAAEVRKKFGRKRLKTEKVRWDQQENHGNGGKHVNLKEEQARQLQARS